MRYFILVLLATYTCACVPIRVVSKYDPDVYNNYTVIQGIQKKDSIGHTDVKQREKDVLDCGVKNLRNGTLDFNVSYPGMSSEQVDIRRISIYNCLESRNYVLISPERCTDNGKPVGICN